MFTLRKGKIDHVVNLFDFSREGMGHFPDTKICQTWNKNNFLAWSFLIFPNMVMSRLWRRYLNTAKLRACFQGERVNLVLGYPINRVEDCFCLQAKFHR